MLDTLDEAKAQYKPVSQFSKCGVAALETLVRSRELIPGTIRRLWGRVSRLIGGQPRAQPRKADHLAFGDWGERLAIRHLERSGFRLVLTNFSAPIGKRREGRAVTGEIDIVAYDESTLPPTLVFIEVKTRSSGDIAMPEAAVDRRKQRQIIRTARVYRRLMRVWDEPYRYDVVGILAPHGGRTIVDIWPGYFSERSAWRKRQ